MFFRQYSLPCLSLFSYMVGDETTGRAVVVDPQRDVDQYLEDARAEGLRIERVVETHLHADFVSGHLELAKATGAAVSYGAGAAVDYPIEPLDDGRRIELGDLVLEIRATPGHTPESISIVILDGGTPWGVLTGDTLFIGDVGRPDLLAAGGLEPADMARSLYRSLHGRLMTLPDATQVFPAHGAGSACGKNMSTATSSTIGEQRQTNYALQPMTEDEFVHAVTEGQPAAPPYFAFAAATNRQSHQLLDDHAAPAELTIDEALALAADGGVILDCRAPETFASGHVRGALNVGIDGRFAEYAGDVLPSDRPVVLITDPGRETEARLRLGRIGFDGVVGAVSEIERVLVDRPELAETSTRLTAAELAVEGDEVQLIDVRNPGELADGSHPAARNIPLARLVGEMSTLDANRPVVVYCAGGYRSSVAASVLRAHGFGDVADVLGGWPALRAA
jgi:glyoxylase-like metal-dependent hydrolase (beta-lactamase superfamily II)/rhodanese-related sulfurtransferase